MKEKLIVWSIDRKCTDAQRGHVIAHMKRRFIGGIENSLPPIYFKPIDEMTDDEVRLLDNLNYMFFKGEENGCFL